jgi:hypothetical protein
VVGTEIPVRVDPERPGGFEIDWDAIPSMEERVAANDPTLADPIGAHTRAREALLAATWTIARVLPAGARSSNASFGGRAAWPD